nr:MAG TPA: hypothetical protein [Ackermannviridae sp.]
MLLVIQHCYLTTMLRSSQHVFRNSLNYLQRRDIF